MMTITMHVKMDHSENRYSDSANELTKTKPEFDISF